MAQPFWAIVVAIALYMLRVQSHFESRKDLDNIDGIDSYLSIGRASYACPLPIHSFSQHWRNREEGEFLCEVVVDIHLSLKGKDQEVSNQRWIYRVDMWQPQFHTFVLIMGMIILLSHLNYFLKP